MCLQTMCCEWRWSPTVTHPTHALVVYVVILNSEECSEWRRCDTYFIYCLRPRFSSATECPNTAPGFIAVSNVSIDGADIDFSQPTVLGLSNPFNLTGITTAWEVMITDCI